MSSGTCYHCGDTIIGKPLVYKDKQFCCNGCQSVFVLLEESGLNEFYQIEKGAGTKPSEGRENVYAFLDVPELRKRYIEFEDDKSVHVHLFLPNIHCSSCIYLLENLHKIEPRVQSCMVNFTRRQASIVIRSDFSLSGLATLLNAIGYPPNFSSKTDINKKRNYTYLYKLGVAGFAFGSIMLWSFPEYLGVKNDNPEFRSFTSWLSLAVSVPVLLYSAAEYLISAWKAVRHKSLNLDVPITIGIIALYAQSVYSIVHGDGPGYMDSFAGFIFFLLIGKWFQNKTYEALSFDRDYTSYFPVAVTRITEGHSEIVEIDKLEEGEIIEIRNHEIIPCDATLLSDETRIDYSFVTGESIPVQRKKGDHLYAGGKLLGSIVRLKVVNKSSRSHLTRLWNEGSRKKQTENGADKLSIYFLSALLVISLITGISWLFIDPLRMPGVLVSVLIVACPCALALSRPFTYGNTLRLLGRTGLYLKSAQIIEPLNNITDIVFDKTGTLTRSDASQIHFEGQKMEAAQYRAILSIVHSSTHPLSRQLSRFLLSYRENELPEVQDYEEVSGLGIFARTEGNEWRIGSSKFTGNPAAEGRDETSVHIACNGTYLGRFVFEPEFRTGILESLETLAGEYRLHLLSGDTDKDRDYIESKTSSLHALHFLQSPQNKFDYIRKLQSEGKKVAMIGDGLNDAGALDTADTGIAVSENVFSFTPGSDAIIQADQLKNLKQLFRISKRARLVLTVCFAFSAIYNIIGLSFAISGQLTPLVAAILMPLSSISVVLISTLLVRLKH